MLASVVEMTPFSDHCIFSQLDVTAIKTKLCFSLISNVRKSKFCATDLFLHSDEMVDKNQSEYLFTVTSTSDVKRLREENHATQDKPVACLICLKWPETI